MAQLRGSTVQEFELLLGAFQCSVALVKPSKHKGQASCKIGWMASFKLACECVGRLWQQVETKVRTFIAMAPSTPPLPTANAFTLS